MREKVWIKIRCGWHVGICEKGKLARKLGQKTGSETGIKTWPERFLKKEKTVFFVLFLKTKKQLYLLDYLLLLLLLLMSFNTLEAFMNKVVFLQK